MAAQSGEPRVVPVTRRRDRILSAGLIDIKTHYSETPDDIIERAYLPGLPRSGMPGKLH